MGWMLVRLEPGHGASTSEPHAGHHGGAPRMDVRVNPAGFAVPSLCPAMGAMRPSACGGFIFACIRARMAVNAPFSLPLPVK
jgi:hypothetical protein